MVAGWFMRVGSHLNQAPSRGPVKWTNKCRLARVRARTPGSPRNVHSGCLSQVGSRSFQSRGECAGAKLRASSSYLGYEHRRETSVLQFTSKVGEGSPGGSFLFLPCRDGRRCSGDGTRSMPRCSSFWHPSYLCCPQSELPKHSWGPSGLILH